MYTVPRAKIRYVIEDVIRMIFARFQHQDQQQQQAMKGSTTTGSHRDTVLVCTENADYKQLSIFAEKHRSKKEDFCFEDVIQTLSKKQHDSLWRGLHQICCDMQSQLRPQTSEDRENFKEMNNEDVYATLEAILMVMSTYFNQEKPVIAQKMIDCAKVLHDIIMDLPDSEEKLRMQIAKLLQKWWVQNFPVKEEMAPNTLVCLITKSLQQNSCQADIKAVNAIKDSLLLVNWDDPSSSDLEMLLEQCMISPGYLNINEGRTFLGSLFGLNTKLIAKFHSAIKNQLPSSCKSVVQHYGEVYFKAWKNASGECLKKVEQSCIQDLMFFAVHANRKGSRSLSSILLQLLGYFTKQKKQQGVDKMLCTLYEPFLWRALHATNPGVRANALGLLIDAFPLQDPEGSKEEVDGMLQKQIDALNTLLCDPYPLVRVIAVQGVCKIIGVYWELLPAATVSSLLAKLIQEEVYDTSSPDVRAAVFKGLKYILDNPLSHPLMKHSLPSLGNFIHDTSEKVIIAFLELLLKVKGIRTIKVSSIVSIEHLLARLEVSSPPLARRLVSLLINSFHPTNQEADVQIERVMRLIRTNQAACRVFYRHAAQQMPTSDAVELMLLLCRCIRGCIKAAKGEEPSMNASGDSSVTSREESKMQMDKENEEEDEEGLSLKDKDVMEGMLEIVAILWTSIGTELSKPTNEALKLKLIRKYSKALPEFLVTFQEGKSVSAIVVLASYLPASAIPSFSNGCLSSLKSLPVSASHESYGPLLTCLVSWGRGRDVLELIGDWLEVTLNPKEDIKEELGDGEPSKKSKKRKKHVVFVEPVQPQPLLGIKFLDWLLGHYPSRAHLLQSCSKELVELMLVLKKVMLSIEKRFLRGSVLSFTTDEVLMKSISAYLRLLIHVQVKFVLTSEENGDTASGEQDFSSHFEELLAWMSRELVPSLKKPLSESSGTSRGGMNLTLQQLSKDLVQSLLQLLTDGLMLGAGGPQLPDQLAFFCNEVLQTDCGTSFLSTSVKVMYHLSNRMLKDYLESQETGSRLQSSVTSLLVTIIKSLSQGLKNKAKEGSEDEINQLMSTIKPDVTESLKLCQRHRALCPSLDKNVLSSIMAAIISEMSGIIAKNGQVPFDAVDSVALLPPLPAFLLGAVASTNVMVGSFVTELQQCVRSGAIETGPELCAIIHILHALKKDRTKVDGLEKCLLNVETQLNSVEGALVNAVTAEEEDDSVMVERFLLFESRKVLNSLLGKDPPTNPPPAPGTAGNLSTESDSSSSSMTSSLNKSKKKLYNSGSSLLM